MKPRKMDLSLPEYVHPLGVQYRAQLVDVVDDEGSSGETIGELRLIKIAESQDTRRRWTTLLHEYMHAVLDVNGVASVLSDELEEIIVQSLEHGLEMFLLAHGPKLLSALSVQKEDDL